MCFNANKILFMYIYAFSLHMLMLGGAGFPGSLQLRLVTIESCNICDFAPQTYLVGRIERCCD